jgi:hypothetical protein
VDREGGVVDRRQASGETGPPGVVAVLVPPAVLQEMETVFQPPVVADVSQQVRGSDSIGIEARHEVPHVVREQLAAGRANFTVDTQR